MNIDDLLPITGKISLKEVFKKVDKYGIELLASKIKAGENPEFVRAGSDFDCVVLGNNYGINPKGTEIIFYMLNVE